MKNIPNFNFPRFAIILSESYARASQVLENGFCLSAVFVVSGFSELSKEASSSRHHNEWEISAQEQVIPPNQSARCCSSKPLRLKRRRERKGTSYFWRNQFSI